MSPDCVWPGERLNQDNVCEGSAATDVGTAGQTWHPWTGSESFTFFIKP